VFIKIDFGVRQNSVLSCHLFAIYIDDTVTRLHVGQRSFIVLYAEDILIFAPSIQELQTIVSICQLELDYSSRYTAPTALDTKQKAEQIMANVFI